MQLKHLFNEGQLSEYLRSRKLDLKAEIDGVPEAELLGLQSEAWADELATKYSHSVPRLDREQEYLDEPEETKVDVSSDFNRASFSDGPFMVPGRIVTYHLPFDGDQVLLRLRGSSYSLNPPRALLVGNEIRLTFTFPSDKRPDIRSEIDREIANITQNLGGQRAEVLEYNEQLRGDALQMIQARKNRALEDREFIGDLGIPIRTREDAPSTYSAPGVERRPVVPPKNHLKPRVEMEPVLVDSLYEHICEVVRAGGRAMERAPGSYADRDEETLRDYILMTLNTHYKGQATGETFQGAGKTDILVRVDDKNIFVGECKWWSGPAGFSEAINQLYSYTTLRDSKLALVIFVDAKGFSSIVEKARRALEDHASFVEWESATEEGEMRLRVAPSPEDNSRHATLHVFLFHIPEAKSSSPSDSDRSAI